MARVDVTVDGLVKHVMKVSIIILPFCIILLYIIADLDCPEFTTGDKCESCIDGYYGDPLIGIPCQKCICNNNIDPNATGNCNTRTGKCLKCINNTTGDQCENCVRFHYGDAINGNCLRESLL